MKLNKLLVFVFGILLLASVVQASLPVQTNVAAVSALQPEEVTPEESEMMPMAHIEMYTDFKCPFCARWYLETWSEIQEDVEAFVASTEHLNKAEIKAKIKELKAKAFAPNFTHS